MADEKAERILVAAQAVFLRYGFKRTTMGDIAEAAGISRPALYLVFPLKEKIFATVLTRMLDEMLEQVRHGVDRFDTVPDKLAFAFEIWCVKPFELMQGAPDAKDLHESSQEFAEAIVADAKSAFDVVVGKLLEPLVRGGAPAKLSSLRIARVLTGAAGGFKHSAADVTQLRRLIGDLITIACAALRKPDGASAKP